MIPSDKIVVVTGDPRSGTSLMMQTLQAMGVPIAGEQFPMRDIPEARLNALSETDRARLLEEHNKRKADSQDKNPGGFYEIPGVVMRGLKEAGEYGGKAVKIVSPGAYPHHRQGTPSEIVHKSILCLRDPRAVAVSQSKLGSNMQVAGPIGWDNATWKIDPTRYMTENGGLAYYIAEQADRSRWLVVDYDHFLEDPLATVASIAKHLELEPDTKQIASAVRNVDPQLRRSPQEFEGWGDKQLAGELAERLYAALETLDGEAIQATKVKIDEQTRLSQLESNQWYMRDIGVMGDAALFRQLGANPTLRGQLLADYKKDLHRCLHPQVDATFDDNPSDAETYTIERPADLGPLTRKMVAYHGEVMTWEAAYTLAQRSYGSKDNKRDDDKLASELGRIS